MRTSLEDNSSNVAPSLRGTKKSRLASFKALTPSPIIEGAHTANTFVNAMNTTPRNNRLR